VVKTLADYIAVIEPSPPPLATRDALRQLAVAAENFRRQTSRAEVDPGARESARSAGLLLDGALTRAKETLDVAHLAVRPTDQRQA
jgi:hypothetical protein